MSRILYADDEEPCRIIVSSIIKKKGPHELRIFTDGQELLTGFLSDPSWPDVVITDHEMPNMKGLDAIREIRKVRADIPIILVSGCMDLKEEELKRENIILIEKPFSSSRLREAITDEK